MTAAELLSVLRAIGEAARELRRREAAHLGAAGVPELERARAEGGE